MINLDRIKKLRKTYGLFQTLSSINGPDISRDLLDKVMYSSETLPPLGKEYWWFLFLGQNSPRPVQFLLMIFRKHGKKMWIDDKKMTLKELGNNKLQAAVTSWVSDGSKICNLGDTNAVVKIANKRITTELAGQELIFSGGFPDYKLKIGEIIDLNIKKSKLLSRDKEAYGMFAPPIGAGWINLYPDVEGTILGKKFKGTGHLQKVIGVIPHFPYNWARVIFQNGSMARFSCIKPSKESKIYLQKGVNFYDNSKNELIEFNQPALKISKTNDSSLWTLEGKDKNKEMRIVLEVYAKKQLVMKGGGSLTYIEYCVVPKEFFFKTKKQIVTLDDLGKGVGTLEDAYW